MLNVLELRKGRPRFLESTAPSAEANTRVDIAALTSRIIDLQSEAKGEIGNAVSMLDLAAQHAREITSRLADATARKDFDEHVAMIERLLQIAREMAFKL